MRLLAEAAHASCLVITSREEPPEIGGIAGDGHAVRLLPLGRLDARYGRLLLGEKDLDATPADWRALVERFGGTVRLWDTGIGVCFSTVRCERRFEGLDITGVTGLNAA